MWTEEESIFGSCPVIDTEVHWKVTMMKIGGYGRVITNYCANKIILF